MVELVPDVSVIIPTLNAARVLGQCLESIAKQQTDIRLEVLVVDADSTDGSREIAQRYGARILDNPGRTGEAGKSVGLRAARGDLVAFIDSDNVLVDERWFEKMVVPFAEPDIVASEPLRYVARGCDGYLTRYFAHLGMGDPLCLFLGNYDRYSVLTGRWTKMLVRVEDRLGYQKVWLRSGQMPTIGANGFVVRRKVVFDLGIDDYYVDIDVVARLLEERDWALAKVTCGIVHLFAGDVRSFRRKQRRRIRDFMHYQRLGMRRTNQAESNRGGLTWFVAATLLGWPILWQTMLGIYRTRDITAWLFHPAACGLTLFEYGYGVVTSRWQRGPLDRTGWRQ